MLLAGCGVFEVARGGPANTSANQGVPTPATTAWRTEPLAETQCPEGARVLESISMYPMSGFDRVIFVMDGPAPCYRVNLTADPVQDGSGMQVEVYSPNAIRVELVGFIPPEEVESATQPAFDPGASLTIDSNYAHTVIFSSLYEQSATSFIGVNENAEYAVQTLTNPTRLVIDIRNSN